MICVAQFIEQVQPSLCCTYDLDNINVQKGARQFLGGDPPPRA